MTAIPGISNADPGVPTESGEDTVVIVEFGDAAARDSGKDGLARSAARLDVEVTELARYDTVMNAVAVEVDSAHAAALADLPGVIAVHPVNTYSAPPVEAYRSPGDGEVTRENVTVTDLTGVPEAHRDGATGEGVVIGVVDSGIDYHHPALGGGEFPNEKVIGGYDVVDRDPDPYDEATLSGGHGTHVAGIAAGEDDTLVGVAKDARIMAYRVFGEERPTTDVVVLEALERAVADGVDVVNLSLGQAQSQVHQNALLPRALDAVAAQGVVPVVAIGNGFAGPFKPGSPGIASEAITVGSVYSSGYTHLALTLGSGETVPFNVFHTGPAAPASGTLEIVDGGAVCEPAAPGSLAGVLVLSTGGAYPCTPTTMVANATAGGAAGVLYYDDSEWTDPDEIPEGHFWGVAGTVPAVAIRQNDARLIQQRLAEDGTVTAEWGSYWRIGVQDEYVGTPDASSSWGPSHELDYKPDLVAPGGYVFSTLPSHMGHYGVNSGTSMAAPHVAGAVAVLLSERGDMTPRQVRDLLQSTARPTGLSGAPADGLHPVAQQGAGLIDLPAALATRTTVSPAKLPLGELEGATVTREVTLTNTGLLPAIYRVDTEAGHGAAPPYTSEYTLVTADAEVQVRRTVVVPPHGSTTVRIRIGQPENVPDGTVFGGWVEFDPLFFGESSRVSYMGVSGDWHAVSAINPTFTDVNTGLDNPALRPGHFDFGENAPITVTEADGEAWVMLSHGFPMLTELRMEVVDGDGRVVATPVREFMVVRNSGAGTGMDFYGWDTRLADGTPAPDGEYTLRLSFFKSLDDGPPEIWESPVVTIDR
ncbi:S8 family serine peptidase [Stackebrandtia albiflava]|uniref:S8 family serine peptidase n=1 Tax=Stackebrandtia albiflava TaxID=406432 RepID=UPI0013157EFC|nr:S8 family serine peptidase [Stackebrandtia albiflava]